jgi:predicted DNA-binding protein YlxM (UPF0122 family)
LLDSTRIRQQQLRLLDIYGALLTEHQRHILHLAWEEDWSYGEIADRAGVSRTAVFDMVRRGGEALRAYERKLGLERQNRNRRRSLEELLVAVHQLRREVARVAQLLEEAV